jgi:hypothetical protein
MSHVPGPVEDYRAPSRPEPVFLRTPVRLVYEHTRLVLGPTAIGSML